MEDINYYIDKSKTMKNNSDGGSAAYFFDDLVLVKYENYNKYGLARYGEESIQKEVNKKRTSGVNTPYHYAIKRQIEGDKNICWVLQEKASGVCFSKYSSSDNDGKTQLKHQEELANLSDEIYDKLVSDLCQLFNMGLELKPKNIYLDQEKGFTIIDLLDSNSNPLDNNSLEQVLELNHYLSFVTNFSTMYYEKENVSLEEVQQSIQLSYEIQYKIFKAMQRTLPNFKNQERWVLRSYSKDQLEYFKQKGLINDSLKLTLEEEQEFNSYIEVIIGKCISDISLGIKTLPCVDVNDIRIMLDKMGLTSSWPYHKDYPILNPIDYEDSWELEMAYKESLQNIVKEKLYTMIKEMDNINEFISQAKDDIDNINNRRYR